MPISEIGSLANLPIYDYRDLRGLAVNKPAASSDNIGYTYWSIDTDPNALAIEVSDGTNWVVI
jgi:hypothetical protein